MKGKEKMENKGTILSYRPDIRVVDATIRDGGLVNDFRFTDEFVKNLYQANIKAGVDYMEFGYKHPKIFLTKKILDHGNSVTKKTFAVSSATTIPT